MTADWATRQDDKITESHAVLDRLASDPSVVRRVLALTDGLLTEKHLLNVHLVKRRSDFFRVLDVGCGSGALLAHLVSESRRRSAPASNRTRRLSSVPAAARCPAAR